MQEFKPGREEPELKALVVEASQALAAWTEGGWRSCRCRARH